MRSGNEIRAELTALGGDKLTTSDKLNNITIRISEVLAEAKSHPDVTVSEAADLAGVRRDVAYRLMAKSGRSDAE